ncbi:MAG: hypothetical protein WBD20_11205 [Pirellulaceae bacterium]
MTENSNLGSTAPKSYSGSIDIGPNEHYLLLIHRFVCINIGLMTATGLLFVTACFTDLGFFWFAFIAGVFGACIAFFRRLRMSDSVVIREAATSWALLLMPLLYGGMLAAVAYFLFLSGIITGTQGDGLLAMNLFPDFDTRTVETAPTKIKDWLTVRPAGIASAGKLMVWCFLAGYSENFVSGILQRLEHNAGSE